MARQLGMDGEIAWDLTTTDENGEPWDFSKQKMRENAIRFLNATKHAVLILSPPCTKFSTMQNINLYKICEKLHGIKSSSSNILTKGLKRELLEEHMAFVNGHIRSKRDRSALKLKR